MSLKQFIPAIKYGNELSVDELSYGTVSFVVPAGGTARATVADGSQIIGFYTVASTGSPILSQVPAVTFGSGSVYYAYPAGFNTGSITVWCAYLTI